LLQFLDVLKATAFEAETRSSRARLKSRKSGGQGQDILSSGCPGEYKIRLYTAFGAVRHILRAAGTAGLVNKVLRIVNSQ